MEFGQPSTGAPMRAIEAAHYVLDTDGMGYWESVPLKKRIARLYRDSYGLSVEPERLFLTCGASPAFVLALSCLFPPGARVAFARPGYVAYRNTVKALYLTPVELDCGPAERFQITAAAVAALDPAPDGLIIASPANPTGTIIAPEEMAAIARVCRERGIRIISDEIYHGLTYGKPAATAAACSESAIVINSFSKYFSMTGWRVGWMVLPADLMAVTERLAQNFFVSPAHIAQVAAAAAFDCRAELDANRANYAKARDLLLDGLPRAGFAAFAPPDGAFYVYLDCSAQGESGAFCQRLLDEAGIVATPGHDFDAARGARFLRLSYCAPLADIEAAVQRLQRLHQAGALAG
jgi:aspartate/methionine/tyrosine aminotransferase